MDESVFMVTRITWASVGSVNIAVSEVGFKLNQPRGARSSWEQLSYMLSWVVKMTIVMMVPSEEAELA